MPFLCNFYIPVWQDFGNSEKNKKLLKGFPVVLASTVITQEPLQLEPFAAKHMERTMILDILLQNDKIL